MSDGNGSQTVACYVSAHDEKTLHQCQLMLRKQLSHVDEDDVDDYLSCFQTTREVFQDESFRDQITTVHMLSQYEKDIICLI